MRDSISPVFRLTQDHLDTGDYGPLAEAIGANAAIDATDLSFSAEALTALRGLLSRDQTGRPQFLRWRFVGSAFAADCDFSGCSFHVGRFDRCEFQERASFTKAVFTRASFRHACFGAEANFERVEFGAKPISIPRVSRRVLVSLTHALPRHSFTPPGSANRQLLRGRDLLVLPVFMAPASEQG